jgi:hypothetical protein
MFYCDKRSGFFGVMKFLNGTTYAGDWLYDYQHCRGTMKSIPGGYSYDGYRHSERESMAGEWSLMIPIVGMVISQLIHELCLLNDDTYTEHSD